MKMLESNRFPKRRKGQRTIVKVFWFIIFYDYAVPLHRNCVFWVYDYSYQNHLSEFDGATERETDGVCLWFLRKRKVKFYCGRKN